MESAVGQRNGPGYPGGFIEHRQSQTADGDPASQTHSTERDASRPKRSVLGDVRRITQRRGTDGRDIVVIKHTDDTETVLIFNSIL